MSCTYFHPVASPSARALGSSFLLTHWPTDLVFFFFFFLFLNNFMPQDLQSAAITATSPSDWPLFVGGGALLGTAGLAQCPPLSAIRHSAPPVWSVGLSVHWCSFGAPPHSPFACVLFICSCDPHQICQRFRCRSFSPFALLPFCSFYHARTHE